MSQYDWLKGSHRTKVVWLPKETDYSYCEFVAPNTPYYDWHTYALPRLARITSGTCKLCPSWPELLLACLRSAQDGQN